MTTNGMSISAVTFDGDGTLWDVLAAARRALSVVAETINQKKPADTTAVKVAHLETARADAERAHPDWSMELLRRQSFADVVDSHKAVGVNIDHLWTEFLDARRAQTQVFDDAIPTLRLLREHGILTCLLSNGNTLPEQVGLSDLFDHVQVAEFVGVRKPDPVAFITAADALDCFPDTVLHVGDDQREDYAAALAAGFRAVLLRRTGPPTDHSIATLSTVPAIVDQANQR